MYLLINIYIAIVVLLSVTCSSVKTLISNTMNSTNLTRRSQDTININTDIDSTELNLINPLTTKQYNLDEALSHIGVGYYQYRLLFLCGMINAADAMEMMLLSFLLPKLKRDWELNKPWDGTIGAIAFIGQLLGTSICSILSDKYGRKYIVIGGTLGCAIFSTLSAFSNSLFTMLLSRFLVGFFVASSASSYTLFAELCPTNHRGNLLVIEQSFWAFGAIFGVLLAWITLSDQYYWFKDNNNDWRYFLFLSALPLWIISCFYSYVPESPRWFLAANNTLMATKVLQNVAKINGKSLPKGKLKANTTINIRRGKISDVFCVKQYQKTSILLYISFWCCVFGYYGISFISERYFELFGNFDIYSEMVISTSSEIPSLLLGLFMLDRFGRKNTMTINFGIFAFCCIGLSISNDTPYFGLFGVFLARMSISLSFMAIYIYFSEYYPTVIRSTALGCASALGRFAGIATSYISQDLSIKMGMMLYGLSGIVASVSINSLPQDTLGKDLATSVQSQINLIENKIKLTQDDDDSD